MKKIQSLFKRDYVGNRQVYDEVVEGSEWVVNGEGIATVKHDGTSCMVQDGKLYRRYDRKLTKSANRRKKRNPDFVPQMSDFKSAPDGWLACENKPNLHTGHWPGWLLVENEPESKYHREAFGRYDNLADGTYELVGPKVSGNPYDLPWHDLWEHGFETWPIEPPRTFDELKWWFSDALVEGIVWHHPDGRMVKIKRRDFGYRWPVND